MLICLIHHFPHCLCLACVLTEHRELKKKTPQLLYKGLKANLITSGLPGYFRTHLFSKLNILAIHLYLKFFFFAKEAIYR